MDPYILFAMPASLYSGKARSYLRTHRIEYVERAPGDARYSGEIDPAIGRWIIPVLQTPDGTLVQDTVDIIDFLDAGSPPAAPPIRRPPCTAPWPISSSCSAARACSGRPCTSAGTSTT